MLDGAVNQIGRHVGRDVDDVDSRQFLNVLDRKLTVGGVDLVGLTEPAVLAVEADAEQAALGREEGLDVGRVGLGQATGVVDVIVGDDHHAPAGRLGIGSDGDGVEDVERAVGRQGRRGTHRRGHDDGLRGVDGQVEEVAGLLEGVRAVGDDDAVDVVVGEEFIDPLGQLEPDGVAHILAADVGDLLAGDPREILQLGHGVDQNVDADLARGVAGLGLGLRGAGDRAAGRQNDDVGFCSLIGGPGDAGDRDRGDEQQCDGQCLSHYVLRISSVSRCSFDDSDRSTCRGRANPRFRPRSGAFSRGSVR